MNKSKVSFIRVFSLIVLSVVVAGCTLSASDVVLEPPSDAVYTSAAQTIVAQYTQDASSEGVDLPPSGTLLDVELPPTEETIQNPEPKETEEVTFTEEPTATPTQTEKPTNTPVPEAIWEDNFSNSTLWYSDDGDDYGFEYQDEGYIIYNNLLNAAIWSLGYLGLSDVDVEVDASRVGGPVDGYFGVFCRHANDGLDYYAMVIGDNGFYGILIMRNEEKEFLETGMDEEGIINQGEGEINRIRGVCAGNLLSLYVNDEKLLEVTDETHTIGGVGLIAGNQLSGVGLEVLFDNFVISEP